MTENYDDSEVSASGESPKKDCPKSPSPDKFEIPDYPLPVYYEGKVSKDKLQALKAAMDDKKTEAGEKREESIAIANKTKHTAKAAYEAAEMKYKSDKSILNLKTKNKKGKMWQAFIQCLGEALPKNCSGSGDTDVEKDSRVPNDKRAICIAQLKSGLAIEEVTYLTELRKISLAWSTAASSWKLAQESYDADLCMATAVEEQAKRAAEVQWRSNISTELEKLCK